MAMKQTSMKKVELAEGGSVTGFLIAKGSVMLSYKGGAPGPVPKAVLQDEKGEKFAILLGTTAAEDLELQEIGLLTEIRKGKKVVPTEKGKNSYCPYVFLQDADKKLSV